MDLEVLEDNYGGEPLSGIVPQTQWDQVKATRRFTSACMLVYVRGTAIDEVLAPLTHESIPLCLSKLVLVVVGNFWLIPLLGWEMECPLIRPQWNHCDVRSGDVVADVGSGCSWKIKYVSLSHLDQCVLMLCLQLKLNRHSHHSEYIQTRTSS